MLYITHFKFTVFGNHWVLRAPPQPESKHSYYPTQLPGAFLRLIPSAGPRPGVMTTHLSVPEVLPPLGLPTGSYITEPSVRAAVTSHGVVSHPCCVSRWLAPFGRLVAFDSIEKACPFVH